VCAATAVTLVTFALAQEEYMLTEEGFKVRMLCLRKEEESVLRERERLEREKARCCVWHFA
jgi:hypothetical protein